MALLVGIGKHVGTPGLPEVLIIETDFLIRRLHTRLQAP